MCGKIHAIVLCADFTTLFTVFIKYIDSLIQCFEYIYI